MLLNLLLLKLKESVIEMARIAKRQCLFGTDQRPDEKQNAGNHPEPTNCGILIRGF
jgi:hypothetical protein